VTAIASRGRFYRGGASMDGGLRGFNRKIWRAVVENEALALTDDSPLGEER
jgi:hypothetical protein